MRALIADLRARGKWPAKPSSSPTREDGVSRWLGTGKWKNRDDEWIRTIERPEDPELFLRHEAQEGVPDLLVTNYSMLEYMLLRPIERDIFRETADYYAAHRDQRLILVLDEAHLYRGAQGTEVAMLIRRLRNRLQIPLTQLQVICTSASFSNPDAAKRFAADLAGKPVAEFEVLTGEKRAVEPSGAGDDRVAQALAGVDLHRVHDGDLAARFTAALPVLRLVDAGASVDALTAAAAGVTDADPVARALHSALTKLAVTGRLVNLTSGARAQGDQERDAVGVGPAQDAAKLGARLFPDVDLAVARAATNSLVELASLAKESNSKAPLLAARAHAFFRGLPGLWACSDPNCTCVSSDLRRRWADRLPPAGALYAQPRRTCECGARVFEVHTCRSCGSAYFKAFSFDPDSPDYLWVEDVGEVDDVEGVVQPVFLALEEPPAGSGARLDYLDPVSGRVGSRSEAAREISEKIAAMYLSAVTNRDLSGELAPWADGVNSDHFVVIDSNVDLFLRAVDYDGPMTYRARRAFVQALAARVHLDELHPGVRRYNPRIVQQALYMFMSESNRRESAADCSHQAPSSCRACPRALAVNCSVNAGARGAAGGAP